MQYLGGKKRIAKHIARVIKIDNPCIENYYEPFCGMCSVGVNVIAKNKFFSDNFEPIISYWNALKQGWLPPEVFTKEDYKLIKDKMDYKDPMTAFAGFGCSFSGTWFCGYAYNKRNDDFVKSAFNESKRLSLFAQIKEVEFKVSDYKDIIPKDSVIYIDPPYKNVGKLQQVKQKINYDEFYQHCLDLSKQNKVYISEYNMPQEHFECILEMPIKSNINKNMKVGLNRIEKLFIVK